MFTKTSVRKILLKVAFFTVILFVTAIMLYFSLQNDSQKETEKDIIPSRNTAIISGENVHHRQSRGLTPTPPPELDESNFQYTPTPPDIQKQMEMDMQAGSPLRTQANIDAGLTKEGSDILESGDATRALSISDMPKELQEVMRKQMEDYKEKGYDEEDPQELDRIINIMNYIHGTSTTIPNISFTLSKLTQEIAYGFQYSGYSFASDNPGNTMHDTVRRVFHSFTHNGFLVLEEARLSNNLSMTFIKEMVNANVQGYPALYAIKRSTDNENDKYALLAWNNNKYGFRMYYYPVTSVTRDYLFTLAEGMSKLNDDESKNDGIEREVKAPL